MSAAKLADALGGRRVGGFWIAGCPAHRDRRPSLSINESIDGKLLVHCFAGCDQRRVIAELRTRGLWGKNCGQAIVSCERSLAIGRKSDHDDYRRTAAALAIWESAIPAVGTPVETYLVSRGLHLLSPDVLRFHVGLKHPAGSVGKDQPDMTCPVDAGAKHRVAEDAKRGPRFGKFVPLDSSAFKANRRIERSIDDAVT